MQAPRRHRRHLRIAHVSPDRAQNASCLSLSRRRADAKKKPRRWRLVLLDHIDFASADLLQQMADAFSPPARATARAANGSAPP
jgi:hypothetical protein